MKASSLWLAALVSLVTGCNLPERKHPDQAAKLEEIRKYVADIHGRIDAENTRNQTLEPLETGAGFRFEILSREYIGGHQRIDFYVDSANYQTSEVVEMILSIRDAYCSQSPQCQLLNFWKDKTAYALNQRYQDEKLIERFGMELKAWERRIERRKAKNWVFICENFIASYNGVTQVLIFYPYFDYEYRQYGGRMQKPDPVQMADQTLKKQAPE
ncbi:MAG: hypothetical protein LH606_13480 [Cytophagaceae bacterium]|nr:hypothetical protein [Cytophagaceae bacterium]